MRNIFVNIIGIITIVWLFYSFSYKGKLIDRHKTIIDELFGIDKKTFWKDNARIWRLAFYMPGLIRSSNQSNIYFSKEKIKLITPKLRRETKRVLINDTVLAFLLIIFGLIV